MLGVLLPDDVRPADAAVPVWTDPQEADLDRVGFYVPRYLGPPSDLALVAGMPQLQVVQLLTAGYDHARPHVPAGVTLANAAGVHDASTAELALALMLASLRGIDDFARAMPAGEWRAGRRAALADRTVVIVGAGGVGRSVADRVRAFEASPVLVARTARPGVRGAEDLPDLLPTADVVVLAVPLTEETRGLVDAGFLARMRDGALLVNVARGPVVDTPALLAEAGRIAAALDVTDPEPLPPDHPLWRAPGVLISPHVGGNTSAFLPRARRLVADQVGRWVRGEPILHVVST